MAASTSLQDSTSSTNSPNTMTLTPANVGHQLAAIPFNIPDQLSPEEWPRIRNHAAHLSTNLIQISVLDVIGTDEKLFDMKNILDLSGNYYRHVRSYYWCNSQEALVDCVPKDNSSLPNVSQFTGYKTTKGHQVIVNYDKAIYRTPLQVIGIMPLCWPLGEQPTTAWSRSSFIPILTGSHQ